MINKKAMMLPQTTKHQASTSSSEDPTHHVVSLKQQFRKQRYVVDGDNKRGLNLNLSTVKQYEAPSISLFSKNQ